MDLINISSEKIKFEIRFGCMLWDLPPHATILINDIEKWSGEVIEPVNINFEHTLTTNTDHTLIIHRTGKDNSQTSGNKDQMLWIETVLIDNIDIRDIVYHTSEFYPIYPEPWASEQIALGNNLEYPVLGETIWGHNGTWKFNFSSPFYRYVIHQVTGVRR